MPGFIGVLAGVRREEQMGAAHMRARKSGRQAARGKRAAARYADSADPGLPPAQGLYDPALEKDSCGVGFIADIKGRSSHKLVEDALAILCNLEHRGAVGADPRAGDGAGILVQIPQKFFAKEAARLGFALP
jgi:glutamate synthase (NADPH/NADH) large chain